MSNKNKLTARKEKNITSTLMEQQQQENQLLKEEEEAPHTKYTQKYFNFISQYSSTTQLLIFGTFYFINLLILSKVITNKNITGYPSDKLNPPALDLYLFGYSKNDVIKFYSILGQYGRDLYFFSVVFDIFLYSVSYNLIMSSIIYFLFNKESKNENCNENCNDALDYLFWFPTFLQLIDYFENIILLFSILLFNGNKIHDDMFYYVVLVGSVMTIFKWFLVLVNMAIIVWGVVLRLLSSLSKNGSHNLDNTIKEE
ncbi:hypothetical protein ABK040_010926 [Willaertia magna]